MNGMKKILTLLFVSTALAACQDDLGLQQPGATAEGMTDIILSSPAMPHIVTRADGQDENVDYRVDNVILFAFSADGELLNNPVQQTVRPETENKYKFRSYLPEGWATLRAVCNYDDPEGLIAAVADEQELATYKLPLIQDAEDAFKGVYVMEGKLPKDDVTNDIVIPVARVVSRHTFNIKFDPDYQADEFKVINIALFNVPNASYLVEQAGGTDATTNADGTPLRDCYLAPQTADEADDGNAPEEAIALDFTTIDDNPNDTDIEYTVTTHLFENRRGTTDDDRVDEALKIADYPDSEKNNIRQAFKRALAKGIAPYADADAHPYASCLIIQGMYEDKKNGKGYEVTYHIYLGKNNYSDFNVCRNTDYTYDIAIRACDEIDTRVNAEAVGDIEFNVSKDTQPFDAHFNVREALLRSTRPWTVYVKDPDQHPWLEISESPVYRKRDLGTTTNSNDYAQFRLEGNPGLQYLYIHTDEYVPDLSTGYLTEWGYPTYDTESNKELAPRTAEIVFLYDGQTEDDARQANPPQVFTVVQYPAQMVLETENVLVSGKWKEIPHYFFVERIAEEKYKDWGFRHHWSLELDLLISQGHYDGLKNSRHEYVTAYWGDAKSDSREARQQFDPLPEGFEYLSPEGYENAAYWEDSDEDGDYTDEPQDIASLIPSSTALGYALAKNRDRNSNGRIDYEEMLWYLPSTRQLEAIYKAIQPGGGTDELSEKPLKVYGLYTQDTDGDGIPDSELGELSLDGNYWSSTPSASDKYGITSGRAYYVEMSNGKQGIALRDQSYNVIVCRDAGGWLGPETGNGSGGVNVDTDWNDDEEHNTPR